MRAPRPKKDKTEWAETVSARPLSDGENATDERDRSGTAVYGAGAFFACVVIVLLTVIALRAQG